jgi:hypothetical protein
MHFLLEKHYQDSPTAPSVFPGVPLPPGKGPGPPRCRSRPDGPSRPQEDDILLAVQEAQLVQAEDLGPVDGRLESEIEGVQSFHSGQPGGA